MDKTQQQAGIGVFNAPAPDEGIKAVDVRAVTPTEAIVVVACPNRKAAIAKDATVRRVAIAAAQGVLTRPGFGRVLEDYYVTQDGTKVSLEDAYTQAGGTGGRDPSWQFFREVRVAGAI